MMTSGLNTPGLHWAVFVEADESFDFTEKTLPPEMVAIYNGAEISSRSTAGAQLQKIVASRP